MDDLKQFITICCTKPRCNWRGPLLQIEANTETLSPNLQSAQPSTTRSSDVESSVRTLQQNVDSLSHQVQMINSKVEENSEQSGARIDQCTTAIKQFSGLLNEMGSKVDILAERSINQIIIWKVNETEKRIEVWTGKILSLYSPPFFRSMNGYQIHLQLFNLLRVRQARHLPTWGPYLLQCHTTKSKEHSAPKQISQVAAFIMRLFGLLHTVRWMGRAFFTTLTVLNNQNANGDYPAMLSSDSPVSFTEQCVADNFPPSSIALSVLQTHYAELTCILFTTNISPFLVAKGVITIDDVEMINAKFTMNDKAQFVLGIISQHLKAGSTKSFKCLLDVMEQYGTDPMKDVAKDLKYELSHCPR